MRPWTSIAVMLLLLPTGIHAVAGTAPLTAADTSPQVWIWSPDHPASLDPSPIPLLDTAFDLAADMGLPSHRYDALGMMAFIGTRSQADAVVAHVGGHVEPNQHYDLHLDRSVRAIEAEVVIDAVGSQRSGPSVLVIDTGVDSRHPDFQSGNLAANFAADRLGGLVVGVQTPEIVVDEAGHGTHVAGIVAGSGEALGSQDSLHDKYRGAYHNGRIVGFQALAENTEGDSAKVDTAAALQAMEWALQDGARYDVKVVQASWGTGGDLDPRAAVTKATLELYLAGMNVVFSAGNRGTENEALNSFCQPPWVLCIANVDNRGSLQKSSSVGTSSSSGRPYAHPDVAAPGTFITAAGSTADPSTDPTTAFDDPFSLTASQDLYQVRTGTSMAAPHVSGVMALLLAANPELSPDQVMDVLVETATPSVHSVNEVGTGMINAREAYNLAINTPGNRDAFEAGQQVKYGGPATGDDDYSDDPVSIGYTETPTGNAVTLPPPNLTDRAGDLFQVVTNEIPREWLLAGGAFLALLILIALMRRASRKRRARRAARRAAKPVAAVRRRKSRAGDVSFSEVA